MSVCVSVTLSTLSVCECVCWAQSVDMRDPWIYPQIAPNMGRHATWYGLSVSIRILALSEMIRPYRDTDLRQITEKQFLNVAKQISFIVDTTSFFRLISEKTGDFISIRGVGLIRLPRHVKVKLRFWFFAAGCRFLLHNVAIFLQTVSRYESCERFRDTSMHRL